MRWQPTTSARCFTHLYSINLCFNHILPDLRFEENDQYGGQSEARGDHEQQHHTNHLRVFNELQAAEQLMSKREGARGRARHHGIVVFTTLTRPETGYRVNPNPNFT